MYNTFYGAQDNHFSKLIPYKFLSTEDSVIQTKYDFIPVNYTNSLSEFTLGSPEDYENNIGYTNFQIIGDPTKIKSVELYVCGKIHIDKIHPYIDKQMHFSILSNEILPSMKNIFYKIQIHLIHSEPVQIRYDKVTLANKLKDNETAEILFSANQYHTELNVIPCANKINMHFNHPIKRITVYGIKLYYVKLNLDGYIVRPSMVFSSEDTWVFVFEKPINFSRMDKPFMDIHSRLETPQTINIVAEHQNTIRITSSYLDISFAN